jgi:hypothetical protein
MKNSKSYRTESSKFIRFPAGPCFVQFLITLLMKRICVERGNCICSFFGEEFAQKELRTRSSLPRQPSLPLKLEAINSKPKPSDAFTERSNKESLALVDKTTLTSRSFTPPSEVSSENSMVSSKSMVKVPSTPNFRQLEVFNSSDSGIYSEILSTGSQRALQRLSL